MNVKNLKTHLFILGFLLNKIFADPVILSNSTEGKGFVVVSDLQDNGKLIRLTAVPQVDWEFSHWEGVDNNLNSSNSIALESGNQFKPVAIFKQNVGAGRDDSGTLIVLDQSGKNLALGSISDIESQTVNLNSRITNAWKISISDSCGGVVLRDGRWFSIKKWFTPMIKPPLQLTNIVDLDSEYQSGVVRTADGKVFGWGYNEFGQLDGLANYRFKDFSLGTRHSCGILTNGVFKSFGWQDSGGEKNLPTEISPKSITSLKAGFGTSLVLLSQGQLKIWGTDYGKGFYKIPDSVAKIREIDFFNNFLVSIDENCDATVWPNFYLGLDGEELRSNFRFSDVFSSRAQRYFATMVASSGKLYHFRHPDISRIKAPAEWDLNNAMRAVITAGDNGIKLWAIVNDSKAPIVLARTDSSGRFLNEGDQLNLTWKVAVAHECFVVKNGVVIGRSTGPFIRIDNCKKSDSGEYQMLFKNANGFIATESVSVSVTAFGAPKIIVDGVQVAEAIRKGDKAFVVIQTEFAGGQIFYTTNGDTPSIKSNPYISEIEVNRSTVIKAIALNDDFTIQLASEPVSVQIVPTFGFTTTVIGSGQVQRTPSDTRHLQDEVVGVKAIPSVGWRFARWEGDLSGAFPERNVAMNRDKTVRAVFEAIPRYTLATTAKGGAVTGNGAYYQGSTVQLQATPSTGWSFLGWTGDYVGADSSFSWTVESPASFVANFGTTISNVATGSGQIILEPTLPVYPYGTEVRVNPVPNAGFALALWGGVGAGQPKSEWIFKVTNATPKITALFQALATDKAVLTAQSTLGGRLTQAAVDGIYAKGTSVVLTPVPEAGYEFTSWSGDASGSDNPLTVVLDSSKTVKAGFRKVGLASYPVTVAIIGPGTVRRVPDLGAYEAGSEVELVAETTGSSLFAGWTGAATNSQKRIRISVAGPVSATAKFKSVYPVATEARGEGQILLSPPDANYVEGTSVALTAKPAEGWGFVQWSGDLGTTAQESMLTVDAPKRVVAEFARLGTLTLKNIGQGTVSKVPEGSSFLPGTSVRLSAMPAPGWKFIRWSGGATGTNPELAVVVGRTEAIVAEFADGEAPKVTLTEPVSGNVRDERFTLKGSASDNLRLASVSWTWNGVPQGAVPMGDGVFSIEGLTLQPGTNQIVLDALDAVGNATRVERMVVWTPVRSLLVKTAPEVQEGQRLVFPVTLDSPGDVAGLTFQLSYDPVWLADPQWEWGALAGQSVNTLNTATNGQIWATFSMPGQTLPAGVQSIANVSFRARSVPEVREVDLKPSIRSVSGLQGDALSPGNAALAGHGRIKSRRIKGDNNANQRLEIGDAVVVARLQVGLDEARTWDVTLNDLNASGSLDNGDVVKVLRAVVGLDVQPGPGSEGKRFAAALGLAKALVNTNDLIALELIDGPTATKGQPYRIAVRLNRVKGNLSGLSFTVKYPASLSLTDKQVGALVPGDALPLWNEGAGQVSLAAIRSTAWANATGVAAVLTFVPTAAFSGQAEWPLRLEQSEITGSGFDVRPVDPVTAIIQTGGGAVDDRPQITLQPPKANGTLGLEIRAPQGATLAVETTSDLSAWTETQRITGQGNATPVKVTFQADPNVQTKFWRVRVR